MLIPFPRPSSRPLAYLLTTFQCAIAARDRGRFKESWVVMETIAAGIEDAADRLLTGPEAALLRHLQRDPSQEVTVGSTFGGTVLARYLRDFAGEIEAGAGEMGPPAPSAVPAVVEQLRRFLIRLGYGAVVETPADRARRRERAAAALPRARDLLALLRRLQVPLHPGGSNGHFHYGGEFGIARVAADGLWCEQGVAEDLIGPIAIPPGSLTGDEIDWEFAGTLCHSPQGLAPMDVQWVRPLGVPDAGSPQELG
jgi:hypothetical protein